MRLKQLALQIRESGAPLRPEDGSNGPLIDKSKASDAYLVKRMATCDSCGGSLTAIEIKHAVAAAHDIDSFDVLVNDHIEHHPQCPDFLEMLGEEFVPPRTTLKAKKKRSSKKVPKAAKAKSKRQTVKKKATKKKKVATTKAKRGKRR
jgi:hypothetical protein